MRERGREIEQLARCMASDYMPIREVQMHAQGNEERGLRNEPPGARLLPVLMSS